MLASRNRERLIRIPPWSRERNRALLLIMRVMQHYWCSAYRFGSNSTRPGSALVDALELSAS